MLIPIILLFTFIHFMEMTNKDMISVLVHFVMLVVGGTGYPSVIHTALDPAVHPLIP